MIFCAIGKTDEWRSYEVPYHFSLLLLSAAVQAGSLPFSYPGVLNSPDAYVLQHTEVEVELAASVYSVEDTTGGSNSEFMITGHLDLWEDPRPPPEPLESMVCEPCADYILWQDDFPEIEVG